MNVKSIIILAIMAVVLSSISIFVPLYIFKWRQSSSNDLKAGADRSDIILVKYPWLSFNLFCDEEKLLPFSTDQDGVAYTIDSSGRMFDVHTNTPSDVRLSSLVYYTGNRIATLSQITSYISSKTSPILLTSTAPLGIYYFSDDKTKILIGKLTKSGQLEVLANRSPTFDVSEIPDTFFMLGSPSETILDVLSAKPLIRAIANLNETFPVLKDSQISSTFFGYMLPLPFFVMFKAGFKADVLDGSLSFGPVPSTQVNFLKRGWSLMTLSEANAAFNRNTVFFLDGWTYVTRVALLGDTNSGQVSTYYRTFESGQFVLTNPLPTFRFLLVKSSTPLSTIPNVSDIIDLSIVLGRIGNIIPQSLTEGIVPEVSPQVPEVPSSSTTPKAVNITTNKNIKVEHSKELVIYISVGLVGTAVIVMTTFFWMRRESSSPHTPQQ
jgi:flagellar basal body-associated protein FliL